MSRPYIKSKQNFLDIFNEAVILIVACCLFVFTDLVMDFQTKFRVGNCTLLPHPGWFVIFIILFNVAINLVNII